MGKIAFVFAGQGAQYSGMGKELYEHSSAAKKIFDMAEQIRKGTITQCFYGSKEELSETRNTQPCLFCIDLAAAESLRAVGITPDVVAGFSLGEIPALAFAGAFSYEDGFKLVCRRAELMQEASEKTDSGMLAVLKLSNEKTKNLCDRYEYIFPVNYNCPGQLVVAGKKEELPRFRKIVTEQKGLAIPLPVSGGFHSPFMTSASDGLYKELDHYVISRPKFPVFANLSGKEYGINIKRQMALQIKNPVLWQKTVENMAEMGVNIFVEVGAGKTLSGLIKKIIPHAKIYHVEDKESLALTMLALKRRI